MGRGERALRTWEAWASGKGADGQDPRGEQVAPPNPGAIQGGGRWDPRDISSPFSCLTFLEFHRLTESD